MATGGSRKAPPDFIVRFLAELPRPNPGASLLDARRIPAPLGKDRRAEADSAISVDLQPPRLRLGIPNLEVDEDSRRFGEAQEPSPHPSFRCRFDHSWGLNVLGTGGVTLNTH